MPQTTPLAARNLCGFYREHGWVAVPDVYRPQETAEIAAIAQRVALEEIRYSPTPSYTVDASRDGRVAPRKIDWPFLKHPAFRDFVLDERLVSLVEAILGQAPCLIRDQLFMKPPRFGSAKPYHQENAPLGIEPADEFVIAWVALDDATLDNGCLRYIDGSHRVAVSHEPVDGREFDVAARPDAVDLSREVAVEVRRGGVLLHHSLMMHSSAVNESDQWRRAYSSHWVSPNVTSRGDALDHAYSQRLGKHRLTHHAP